MSCAGDSDHWSNLFASTSVLQLAARYSDDFFGEPETLALFVTSSLELGEKVVKSATSVLAARYLAKPGYDADPAFLAFAILMLAASQVWNEASGQWLKDLAIWAEEEESRAREHLSAPLSTPWLLGLTTFTLRAGLWRYWGRHILLEPRHAHPIDADPVLRRLGTLISG